MSVIIKNFHVNCKQNNCERFLQNRENNKLKDEKTFATNK